MAVKAKSSLAGKLGGKLKQAIQKAKDEPTNYGQMELPSGIEGGIAQLTECKFDTVKEGKENAGEYYFYAAGTVVAPKTHNGVPIEGMRTSIMEPMYDTPGRTRESVDEHVSWVLNEMRKLGVDTSGFGGDELEATAAALKEGMPYFRFRTWSGEMQTTGKYANKPPRTIHQWNGVVEYGEEGTGDDVEDDSGLNPPPGDDVADTDQPAEEEGDVDVAQLAEAADGGDEDAALKLQELATEAGVSEDDFSAAANYGEIAELITAAQGGESDEEEEAEEEEESRKPSKGDVYFYQVIDPKTKKPAIDLKTKKPRKPVECEVMAVDKKKKTVTLLNQDDKKTTYKDVPWGSLTNE